MTLRVCHFRTCLLSPAVLLVQYRSEYLASSRLPCGALKGKEETRLSQGVGLNSPSLFRFWVAFYNPRNTSGTAGVDVGVRGPWPKCLWASMVNARWGTPFRNHSQAGLWLLLRHVRTQVYHENCSQNQKAVVFLIPFYNFLLVSLCFLCICCAIGTWWSNNSLCCCPLISHGCIPLLKYIRFNELNYFYT